MPVKSRVVFNKVESTQNLNRSNHLLFPLVILHSLCLSIMEIMSLSNLAMRQLGAYVPFLQSGVISESWFAPLIEWAIRIAVVGLFASAFKTGRSKHGPWESVRIGE